jgi:hypothetical protein
MVVERIVPTGQLVPLIFSQDAAADSQSAVAMNILEVAATVLTVTEYQMPYDFDIVAVSVVSDDARTAGTLTVDPTIDGTVTGLTAVLNGTDTLRDYARQPMEKDRGIAGQRVGCKLTTASWTPVTADIVAVVWVIVHMDGL